MTFIIEGSNYHQITMNQIILSIYLDFCHNQPGKCGISCAG